MKGEFGGRGFQRRDDDIAADAHALAFDDGSGPAQNVARFGKENIHPDVLEDLERVEMNGLDLVVGKDA